MLGFLGTILVGLEIAGVAADVRRSERKTTTKAKTESRRRPKVEVEQEERELFILNFFVGFFLSMEIVKERGRERVSKRGKGLMME